MFFEHMLNGAVDRHCLLLSGATDSNSTLSIYGETVGNWGDQVEVCEICIQTSLLYTAF